MTVRYCFLTSAKVISLALLFFVTGHALAETTLEFVPNEVIVQYKRNTSSIQALSTKSTLRRALRRVIRAENKQSKYKGELAAVKLSAPVNSAKQLAATIQKIMQDPEVEYAEPNWILHKLDINRRIKINPINIKLSRIANDQYFLNGESWGMYGGKTAPSNSFGSRASEVWFNTLKQPLDCSDVYIGVIDEGIMDTHPDLKQSIWENRFEQVDGKDNDGNGYIDDVNGWDFYHHDRTIYHKDEDYHGTHIAGIIAAAGNNDTGVAGVCWNTKLIALKFLGPQGGDTVNAIKAIDYITDLKIRHRLNIVATNNSWGSGGYSQAMIDAIKRAEDQNILFIAAAGNSGTDNDTTPLYPASYPNANIISVAAIGQSGMLSTISNRGFRTVDIAAPGENIISTVPDVDGNPGYGYDGGTSMAAPFVTGAVALLAHKHATSNASRIKQAILNGAMPYKALQGMTQTGGRLDIPRALQSDLVSVAKKLLKRIKTKIIKH